MFAVVIFLFLDRPIGQVHGRVLIDVQRVLVAAQANVAFFKQEPTMLWRDQNPQPDVELALVDEHRPLNVLLNHDCFRLARRLHFGCRVFRNRNSVLVLVQTINEFPELIDTVE